MFKRIMVAALVSALACAPALSAEQVQGNAVSQSSPQGQAATATNKAVVEKNISGTTATITVPPSTEAQEFHVDIKPLIDGLLPYIIAAVGGLISVIGTVVAVWLKQKFNIEIEAKDREAWQQSATNAAGALIARGAVKVEEGTGKIVITNADLAHVASIVAERVPDAIRRLGVTPEQVQSMIIAKVPQVLTGATPAAPAAVVPAKG